MTQETTKRLDMSDGSAILLIDMSGARSSLSSEDRGRNIVRVDSKDRQMWRITLDKPHVYPKSFFVGIGFNEKQQLVGYSIDGVEYEIDPDTGMAKMARLTR